MTFKELTKIRRSIYNLGNTPILPQDETTDLIEACLWNAPSAFNSQSARAIILYGENYQKFWQMVENTLRQIVPADKFGPTHEKLQSFRMGFGTVLFFDDDDVIHGLQENFPLYKDNFARWAEHGNAMVQYMVWMALAEHNVGASLQHYNPLIDDGVKKMFDVPSSWRLIAQMPFGSIGAPADEKTHEPIEKRVKIFK